MNELEERIARVVKAIEASEDAIDFRSNALDRFVAGDIDGAVRDCQSAARAVLTADPDLSVHVNIVSLSAYIGSQVRGLATGEDATLYLLPLGQN